MSKHTGGSRIKKGTTLVLQQNSEGKRNHIKRDSSSVRMQTPAKKMENLKFPSILPKTSLEVSLLPHLAPGKYDEKIN